MTEKKQFRGRLEITRKQNKKSKQEQGLGWQKPQHLQHQSPIAVGGAVAAHTGAANLAKLSAGRVSSVSTGTVTCPAVMSPNMRFPRDRSPKARLSNGMLLERSLFFAL